MTHPFFGTPQYEQQYGNRQGKPIGRPGNGLGSVGRRPVDEVPPDFDAEATESHGEATIAERWGITLDELYDALKTLSARQAFVVRLRYGLEGSDREYGLQEIADLMGITHQSVSELEQRGLKTLQKVLKGRKFPCRGVL